METQILLWGTLSLPLLLGLLFRVGAPHIFFALMAGELLGRYFGHDIAELASTETVHTSALTGEIVLLTAPMILTAFLMRKSTKKSRILFHSVPLAITGIVYAAFLFPLLDSSMQDSLSETFIGGWILNLNKSIIGVVVVAQLISLWLFNRSEHKHKKKD